ncbi:MAG: glycosyltransferase family 4 protein [Coriobacteriia bacterium]|nr:glycosyltransferase family 4 protein [Coriobacteriia bacterium]
MTVPLSASTLLRGQLTYFRERGYDVHLACSPGPALADVAEREGVTIHEIPMDREASSLLRDLRSLRAMVALMRRIKPDIVNAGTPKAGLIGMLAARLTRVRARVYVLRGLRLETATGMTRRLLRFTERLACTCAHTVVCVSDSLRARVTEIGLISPEKALVVGSGSSNGVELARFRPDPALRQAAQAARERLHLDANAPTIGFIGRLTRDKGIVELTDAFERLYAQDPSRRLLLVGDAESGDPLPQHTHEMLDSHPGVARTGFVAETAAYYQLMDVLCLPSYREGFPNAPLEAAAAGKPTVTTDATGARDSVVDGKTGLVVNLGDVDALTSALGRLLDDPRLCRQMGSQAQARAAEQFAPRRIWEGLEAVYENALGR